MSSDENHWRTRPVYQTLWLRAAMILAPLIAAVFIPGEFADPEGSPWLLVAVFLFMAICMWPLGCAAHWVEGDADALKLRYWPLLSRRIPYSEVASVEYRRNVSPWEFGGIGLRLASGGVLALVNRAGPGVGVRLKDGRSYFVIVTDIIELETVRDKLSQARADLAPRISSSE